MPEESEEKEMAEKMKVVGKQWLDFTGKDGNQVKGQKLHCLCSKSSVEGQAIEGIFINERSDCYTIAKSVAVGSDIEVTFNRWGKAESIQPCK